MSLGILAGCAGEDLTFGEVDAAANAEMARRPEHYANGEARAFLVSRGGRVAGLLWGTWHVGYDETTVMPRVVRERFAAASSVSVEVVLDRIPVQVRRAMAEIGRQGLQTADPKALARLDLDTRQRLDGAGLPAGTVDQYSLLGLSWLVTAQAMAAPQGALPQVGFVDLNLIGFARSVSIPVRGLEIADPGRLKQLVYDDPNGEDAAAGLRLALRRQPGARGFLAWLRRRYVEGEVGVLLAGLQAWRAEAIDLARVDRARPALLAARNLAWMPQLEETLSAPGVAFVAFGAAHLTGTDGVVALLRERGWTVSACVGDRCAG